ncbi:MAG TPA: peptide chain release factor N(5)-glutamine methyltransferase [Polyangiales bacterium]
MAEAWTVRRVITWLYGDLQKRGIDSARLEADLLVAHALKQKRLALYLDLDRPLEDAELRTVRALVERRRAFEPIAYILGEREFYGRGFEVNRDVLIPRPDTETLVEQALLTLRSGDDAARVLDLCTGSGAVALTLAAELPARRILATDVSAAALSVATRNAERLGLSERVELRQGDLFAAVPAGERFAAITANPPYVGAEELLTLAPDVRDHEPALALDAGADALSFYRRIAQDAPRFLAPGASLLVEVGYTQASAVQALFSAAGLLEVRSAKDLAGTERVVIGRYAGAG